MNSTPMTKVSRGKEQIWAPRRMELRKASRTRRIKVTSFVVTRSIHLQMAIGVNVWSAKYRFTKDVNECWEHRAVCFV
jgi:hypothetical protein